MKNIQMSLLENANDFLAEALSKAVDAEGNAIKWKFAILSLVQSIELALKERLKREYPALVYSDVDRPKHTTSIEVALDRLIKLANVQLTKDEVDSIYTARDWRNSIIHYEFSFSILTAKAVFARLFGFLADFCRTELDQELQSILPENLWNAALEIELYFDELSKRASERIQREEIDNQWVWACRYCGQDRFVVQDGIHTCYLCGHREEVEICEECNEPVYADDLEAIYIGNYKGLDAWVYICKFCLKTRLEYEEVYDFM